MTAMSNRADKLGKYLKSLLCITTILLYLEVSASANEQVVEILVDGHTITTSDSVATVEVRAQSFGPGFCGVTFSTLGGVASFLAPPLTWSEWTQLAAHIGKVSYIISVQPVCDTGVMAEIRYYK